MNIDEYRKVVHDDMKLASKADSSNESEAFLLYAVGLLINGEEFDDFIQCHYDGVTRRNGNMSIDGYSIDETDGS